ncbi:hypothetical protein DKM19_28080 [Streptosporangium sp. 'caverna']|nr:hypothetical protein DKM19_28080 [Streptosporangium sp. 'caverna']
MDVVRDVHHGITLDDAYRWMETDGEEFHRWLARHAREQLDALPRGRSRRPGSASRAARSRRARTSRRRATASSTWRANRTPALSPRSPVSSASSVRASSSRMVIQGLV